MKPPEDEKALLQGEARRITALRMQMLEAHPFWGYLLLQAKMVPAPDLPSFAATDCLKHIWYNPRFTRHLTDRQLGFVLAHELGHQVFLTAPRRAGRNVLRWNMATDYAINRIVQRIGLPDKRGRGGTLYDPPEGRVPGLGNVKILLDPAYEGMIAEAIYEQLCQRDLEASRFVTVILSIGGGGEGQGDGDGEGATLRFPELADHGGGIDVHLPIDLSPEQREMLRDRIAAALGNWAANARRGDLPGDALKALGLLDPPRVPWQRVLHRFADQALARDEYSRAHPNKRYLDYDVVVPGLHGERVGEVVVSLDTSGSMSRDLLRAVAKELRGIAGQADEMLLIVADSKVQEVVPFDQLEAYLDRGQTKGGGGTDHRPVFQYIEENRLQPAVFIGLTDLHSAFPEKQPRYPVLWVVPENHGKAPWGQVIITTE